MIPDRRLAIAVLALGLLAATSAHAFEYSRGAIRITQPWTRATPESARVAGGFLSITNTGKSPDRLISGSTEISKAVEIHEMRVVNGIMMMRTVNPGITVKSGSTVILKPFAHHLMLMDITRQLRPGETVKGTLVFEKAGPIEVVFSVEPIGARGPIAGTQAHTGRR